MTGDEAQYPCPCCGYLTSNSPGSYDICPICGWEDDVSQLRVATEGGGANRLSLVEAQRNYADTGSSDPAAQAAGRIHVRPPGTELRDPGFRHITIEDIRRLNPRGDYGSPYPADPTELYYWRTESSTQEAPTSTE